MKRLAVGLGLVALAAAAWLALRAGETPTPEADRPIAAVMAGLSESLDPEAARGVTLRVAFVFPDVGESYAVHVREGECEVRPGTDPDADTRLRVASTVWREIVDGERNAALALAEGEVVVEGSTLDLIGFLRLFRL